MGFKISWIAVAGTTKPQLLSVLGFSDTHEEDEANEAPFSAADLGNGWSLIWSNDFEWADASLLVDLPSEVSAVVVQVHEGVMYSAAKGLRGANIVWSLVHDAQQDQMHLDVVGEPPELGPVREALLTEQAADDTEEVDYVFSIPVEIAARITAFSHEEWDLRTAQRPYFTAVAPISQTKR